MSISQTEQRASAQFGARRCALFQATVALFATVVAFVLASMAQAAFPDKPIRLIIGFPAGGPLDQHARLLALNLQELLGQQIVVDYKPVQAARSVPSSSPNRRLMVIRSCSPIPV